jgi:peptidyl-prolyl cis-trans isomerase B (cyclophilin B)
MGAQVHRRRIVLAAMAAATAGVIATITILASTEASAAGGCRRVAAPAPKHLKLRAPKQTVEPGEELTAVVQTSCGTFDIALDTHRAPKTTNSFAYLSEEGFYDNLTFHRVVPRFVIQGGDPLGTGTGGPGYGVVEKAPADLRYTRGIVAMAKSSADASGRSGSQFFVVTTADASLSPEYALLGKISRGYPVVARIGKMGTPTEKPKQTILIEKITIKKG